MSEFFIGLNSVALISNRMSWIAGLREGKLYTISMRPLDPRWSDGQLQIALGFCATGLHLGWTECRAFQAAEGIVMSIICPGIIWIYEPLVNDMYCLKSAANCHEETTSDPIEL
jgi:hypothetical protein